MKTCSSADDPVLFARELRRRSKELQLEIKHKKLANQQLLSCIRGKILTSWKLIAERQRIIIKNQCSLYGGGNSFNLRDIQGTRNH